MRNPTTQRLIAVLCLLAFGLGQMLCVSRAVRCRDASGGSRIELVCVKSSTGACLASCDDSNRTRHPESVSHSPDGPVQPCEDEPLVDQAAVAKALPKPIADSPLAAAIVMAVLVHVLEFAEPDIQRVFSTGSGRDRPPDAIARLRTVILIV
ncbi:MAG: hypothetical protein ACKVW3_14950 [Phycisphaerales bacterium]